MVFNILLTLLTSLSDPGNSDSIIDPFVPKPEPRETGVSVHKKEDMTLLKNFIFLYNKLVFQILGCKCKTFRPLISSKSKQWPRLICLLVWLESSDIFSHFTTLASKTLLISSYYRYHYSSDFSRNPISLSPPSPRVPYNTETVTATCYVTHYDYILLTRGFARHGETL